MKMGSVLFPTRMMSRTAFSFAGIPGALTYGLGHSGYGRMTTTAGTMFLQKWKGSIGLTFDLFR